MGSHAQDLVDVPTELSPGGMVLFARNFDPTTWDDWVWRVRLASA